MQLPIFMLWFGFFIFSKGTKDINLENLQTNCSAVEVEHNPVSADLGWPYALRCESLLYDHKLFEEYDADPIASYQCVIWSGQGTVLFNQIASGEAMFEEYEIFYKHPSLRDNDTSFVIYTKNLNTGSCYYVQLLLNITRHIPTTCKQYEAKNHNQRSELKFGNELARFNCEDDGLRTYGLNVADVTFHWEFNCEKLPVESSELKIENFQTKNVGIYTCYIMYNGMKRYVYYEQACIRYKVKQPQPIIQCEVETLYSLRGETATFKCFSSIGRGNPSFAELKVSWKRLLGNTSMFQSCTEIERNFKLNQHALCLAQYPKSCNLYPENDTVPFNLTIRNITDSDFGSYQLQALSYLKIPLSYFFNLTLLPNRIPFYRKVSFIVGISIGSLLVFFALSLVAFYNLIFAKVYIKRLFWRKQPDDKEHGVFLVYHYSKNDDKFAKHQLEEAIPQIKQTIEKMGFSVLDENKIFNSEYRGENFVRLMEECHRILILLTLNFIKDDWSVFSLQKGFKKMVDCGTKLIFLTTPGVRKYLKQMYKNETVYAVIERALKTNYVIDWKASTKSIPRKLVYQLEYALPKVRKEEKVPTSMNSLNEFVLDTAV